MIEQYATLNDIHDLRMELSKRQRYLWLLWLVTGAALIAAGWGLNQLYGRVSQLEKAVHSVSATDSR